jgi:hypothetical protein
MSKPLLVNEYERKYYDVDIEYHLVTTVTKRVYVDEMEKHVDNYYDCDALEKQNIMCLEVGHADYPDSNRKFAEYSARDLVEDEELHGAEVTKTFVTGSEEGSEQWGDEVWECVLCKHHFTGYGNNPDPLAMGKGECCDACNTNQVIPARIKMMVA